MTAYQNVKLPLTTTLLNRLQTRANRSKNLRLHSINLMSLTRAINKQCSFSRHRSQKHIRSYIMLVCTRQINLRFKTTTQKQRKTSIHIQLLHQDPWDPITTVEIWTSLSKRVNSILRLQNCHSKKSRNRGGWIQRYYKTLPIWTQAKNRSIKKDHPPKRVLQNGKQTLKDSIKGQKKIKAIIKSVFSTSGTNPTTV